MLSDDFEALTGSKAMRAFLAGTKGVQDFLALSRQAEEALRGPTEIARTLAQQDRLRDSILMTSPGLDLAHENRMLEEARRGAQRIEEGIEEARRAADAVALPRGLIESSLASQGLQDHIRDTILEQDRITDRILELDRLQAVALERESRMLEEARRAAQEMAAPPRILDEVRLANQVLQERIADAARTLAIPRDFAGIAALNESIHAAKAFADTALFRQVASDFIHQRDLISRFVSATATPYFEEVSSERVAEHLTEALSETLAAVQLDGTASTVSFEELALGWYGRVRPEWRTNDVLMLLLTLLSFVYMVLSGYQQGRQLSRIAANSDSSLVEQREMADSELTEKRRANAIADSALIEQRRMNRMLEESFKQPSERHVEPRKRSPKRSPLDDGPVSH